jgi:regulator of replication initiation timing
MRRGRDLVAEGLNMCQRCKDLANRVSELEAANKALRQINTKMNSKNLVLKVENNNLRNISGVRMQPISGAGYLADWESKKELEA